MAKRFLSILTVIVLLTLSLASCEHEHIWGEWEITKEATCTENGGKERKCFCGETEASVIEKLEHDYYNNVCSTCGDIKSDVTLSGTAEEIKYSEASSLISLGRYTEAYEILNGIKNYAPAKQKLENFFFAPQTVKNSYNGIDEYVPSLRYVLNYTYDKYGNIESITKYHSDINGCTHLDSEYNVHFTYDSNGNILTGCDFLTAVVDGVATPCKYTYKDGKLNKVSIDNGQNFEMEYFYNTDGTINKIVNTYCEGYNATSVETILTYYDDALLKTLSIQNVGCWEYKYDASGKVIACDIYSVVFSATGRFTFTYNEFGIDKIYFSTDNEPVVLYTYTYDSNGRLIETKAQGYTLSFSNYQLCYSENAITRNRLKLVNMTDFIFISIDI